MDQELYAVKFALDTFRPYIIGKHVKIFTDHSNLQFLKSVSPKQAKLARWCNAMSEFEFTIYHTPGKKNIVPVVLTQAPLPIPRDTMHNFVLPHINITANMFSFDIPHISSETAKLQFDFALFCLHSMLVILPPIRLKNQTIFPRLLSTNILFPASTKTPDRNMSTP